MATNTPMEHKGIFICQQLILFEQIGFKEQEQEDLPPRKYSNPWMFYLKTIEVHVKTWLEDSQILLTFF